MARRASVIAWLFPPFDVALFAIRCSLSRNHLEEPRPMPPPGAATDDNAGRRGEPPLPRRMPGTKRAEPVPGVGEHPPAGLPAERHESAGRSASTGDSAMNEVAPLSRA